MNYQDTTIIAKFLIYTYTAYFTIWYCLMSERQRNGVRNFFKDPPSDF